MKKSRLVLGLLVAIALVWAADQGMRAAGGAGVAATSAGVTASADNGVAVDAAAAVPAPAAQQTTRKNKPAATTAAASPTTQTVITDAAGRTHTRMTRVTQSQRQAAANRMKALAGGRRGGAQAKGSVQLLGAAQTLAAGIQPLGGVSAFGAPVDPAAAIPSWYVVGPNGQLVPDYSGYDTPNYANSPMPYLAGAVIPVGNPLISRKYASDFPVNPPDAATVAPVLVVNHTPLPVGELQAFQFFNQNTAGSSPFVSAGNLFHAYLLRPTLNPGEYSVAFDSGLITVPATTDPVGVIETVALQTPVPTENGDILAFYGQGIPLDDTGGTDALCYPSPAAPAANTLITVGDASYPVYPSARTYSFGALVKDLSGANQTLTGGIRKFVDSLPGLDTPNNLGQMIPVAVPDKTTYPDADYYEIELNQYTEQMHSDLPPTTLRGYRQTNGPNGPTQPFHYLGPLILAQKGRPVRVKFTNNLPTGTAGNLFIPVDTTVMGSGAGPNVTDAIRVTTAGQQCVGVDCFTQNRATIHLHGGVTPWISDGTTHQWITPAGETTSYPSGVSVFNVPDMGAKSGVPAGKPATNTGSQTFYYTNDQSARLMFYHDHAHGITRLNVYAGEAAGYLLTDQTEADLISAGTLPGYGIPLVIQDKTFVDATTIRKQDPTWNWGTGITFGTFTDKNLKTATIREPKTGDLWWPHVYMPAQNPFDVSGTNPMGRWVLGPYFWPPTLNIMFPPIANPYYQDICGIDPADPLCTMPWQPPQVPATPNPSVTAEAFFDTPMINGTAYPYVEVPAGKVRFRILNASHDRFWNLSLYEADATGNKNNGFPTEVALNAAEVAAAQNDPTVFPTPVAAPGPDWFYVGTEGGFLPKPVRVPPQPTTWVTDPTVFNAGNVDKHSLLLGPAERADVIVNFCAYAGKTLILYNDAPAAFPARDARQDYFTGHADLTATGGAPTTLPGYGPNTRTVMQIRVGAGSCGTETPDQTLTALQTAWAPNPAAGKPGVFEHGQDHIVVGQAAYNGVYTNTATNSTIAFPSTYPNWGIARIQDSAISFKTVESNIVSSFPLGPKAIHDEMGAAFDEYGRMSAALGVELTGTTNINQQFTLLGYADPPTELIKLSSIATLIGQTDDGTQLWKITHNGVDTHPVHFHLFHVQLINRVGWDGIIRLPHPTELGWKDTVRVSPLEDTIVALRPIAPAPASLPFKLPNSVRPLEPALPLHSTLNFKNMNPQGQAITVTNEMTNFGWEYIWHCHILSHEENDMMRAIGFAVPPEAPTLLTAADSGGLPTAVRLTWQDNSLVTTGFTVQRADDANFTVNVVAFPVLPATQTTFDDTTAVLGVTYNYRVLAANTIGYLAPGGGTDGYPSITAASGPSNVLSAAATTGPPAAATGLVATATSPTSVSLTWNYAQGASAATGFRVSRAIDAGAFTLIQTINSVVNGANTFTDTTAVPGTLYTYQVVAFNAASNSPAVTSAAVRTPLVAPINLRATFNAGRRIIVAWNYTATTNATNTRVYRSTDGVNWTLVATTPIGTLSYSNTGLTRGQAYQYRVQAVNATTGALSAFSNTIIVTAQ